jgi:hypothetical protein
MDWNLPNPLMVWNQAIIGFMARIPTNPLASTRWQVLQLFSFVDQATTTFGTISVPPRSFLAQKVKASR